MDHNELDPSIEAFIEKRRWHHPAGYVAKPQISTFGLNYVEADRGVLTLSSDGVMHQTIHFEETDVDLARDLADAINRVLMRHAAAEDKPAHERVRDIVVDSDLPF